MMRFFFFPVLMLLFSNCSAQRAIQNPFEEIKRKVADQSFPKIDGIIVQRGNKMVMEEYFNGFGREVKHDTRSAFKSITSLLVGIAIDQRLMRLDDSLGRFFPELEHAGKRNITVQNLLEMRSGLNCEEFYDIGPDCEDAMSRTEDWVAFCLGVELIRKPGLNWSYNSNEPMLLGEIIARASGMSVMEFAKRYLFQPLGIEDYKRTVSPKGQGMTAGSFFMKPIDMLKIINLIKNKGGWGNKQIISADWIQQSTDCHIVIDASFVRYSRMPDAEYQSARYGFLWYRERLKYQEIDTEVLFASGNGGQYMMWLPAYELTVVFTGSNYGNWRAKLPFELLLKYVLPGIAGRKTE